MGEPGAGRSDFIEALARVLDVESSRGRVTTELDFYCKDTSKPIRIELTLGDLGPELEQRFIDYLELWDTLQDHLVPELEEPEAVDRGNYEWVLRLEYRAQWLPEKEECEEWVHYPKVSDPDTGSYAEASRRDVEELGFVRLRWGAGRILDLSPRSAFRKVVERAGGGDFAAAVSQYVREVARAASQFSSSAQVKAALEQIVGPLRDLLRTPGVDASQLFEFTPEGGSQSGLLRSLGPSLYLGDTTEALPVWRRGSTTAALFRIAEALALLPSRSQILAVDDLGDGLDAASAAHLASVMGRSAGQVWITTRVPAVAEIFEPHEVVRLGRASDGTPVAWQARQSNSKAKAIAAKHWHRNLLPALSYRSVVVVEGPNDFAAIHSLALRLSREHGESLPATHGVSIINVGLTGSGGYPNVLRLAAAARAMGLRAVGIVDGDTRAESKQFLQDYHSLADAVIRLPDGVAIEAALVRDIPSEVLRQALQDVSESASIVPPPNVGTLSGGALQDAAMAFIKKYALHAQFIEALPPDYLPPLLCQVLRKAVEVANGTAMGVVQL
jgi:hypothetical protein